jgi:4-amino-4-deoxy-L-arabinose transferase-like glycosyltransferase
MLLTTALSQRKKFSINIVFWLIAVLLGALQAWVYRFDLSSDDIIAYLDIGDAYLRGDWQGAINGYWSPLYSWILALILSALKPSTYWEFPAVKLVNFLIYLFSFVCFKFFLRELISYYQARVSIDSLNNSSKIPKWAWVALGYALFFWSSLQWIGIYCDTPDMFVAAIVYLAAALVLRIHRCSENWLNFIALGAVLGLGYLSKTAMFPIAFVFLGVAMFSVGNLRRALLPTLVSLLIFTTISSPFIVAISTARGHPTFGDSGKLNYAWLVTRGVTPYRFWQGDEPGSGTPKHPPRQIFASPKVFEFGTPIGGTYPAWHDPSYWYEGLLLKFDLKSQVRIFLKNAFYYYPIFLGGLIFSYLIILSVSGRLWLSLKQLTKSWVLLIPAATGLGIYMLGIDMLDAFIEKQPSTRYIAPFIVLLFAGVFSSVSLPDTKESKRFIAGMTLATLITIGVQVSYQALNEAWTEVAERKPHIHWQVAENLNQLGVQPGDKVALLGHYIHPHYHWARLARVKIVAEIMDADVFWVQEPTVRSEILKKLERTGARVIVQKPEITIPDSISTMGWQKLGNTSYYAYFFQK